MSKIERSIWIGTVSFLTVFLLFGIFIGDAKADTGVQSGSFNKLSRVMRMIKSEFVDIDNVNDEALENGAIKGMIDSLGDKHSNYLSVEEMKEMNTTSDGKFGGVGMVISKKDDYIVVESAIDDTPAYNRGMKAGDLLISVDGVSLKGVSVSEAANKLRGTPGTNVKVEFTRYGVTQEVTIRRAMIDVPSVRSDFINDVGYLRLTQFTGTTSGYVKKTLRDFKSKNVKGIIVDLRSNPGGLLSQVIEIVDMFQNEGVIVSTKGRNIGENTVSNASSFNTIVPIDTPIVVLVDKWSASASEIFAGAIKDTKRGVIIGEKTYGKGSVQTIIRLGQDGFKLTIAKYYTPSGTSIDGIGVVPDIIVEEPEFTEDEKNDLEIILKDNLIDKFIDSTPKPSEEQITVFLKDIKDKGIKLSDRYLRRMIRQRIVNEDGKKQIYDLEYDTQLQKAMEVINKVK